jgi:hypothetical protein
MGIVVKNQEVNMPAGFRGSYADHVIELGIKRALRNKTQKEKKLAGKIEREFSNDTHSAQHLACRMSVPNAYAYAECLCRMPMPMPNVCAESKCLCRMPMPNVVLRVCS